MLIESLSWGGEAENRASSAVEVAAARLVAALPADQALGLRLLALARAAAAMHAGAGGCRGEGPASPGADVRAEGEA